jgi:hypothetical protein
MTKLSSIVALLTFSKVRGDVPVSCRMDQIAGYTWNFHVSKEK